MDDVVGPEAKLDRTHGEPVKVEEAKNYIEERLKELPQSDDLTTMWQVLKIVMADSNIKLVARPKIA